MSFQPNAPFPPPAGPRYSPDFEAFWNAYPRAEEKPLAWKAWQAQRPELSHILQALQWQLKRLDWHKENGRYIPNAVNYLTNRRWEDKQPPSPYNQNGYFRKW